MRPPGAHTRTYPDTRTQPPLMHTTPMRARSHAMPVSFISPAYLFPPLSLLSPPSSAEGLDESAAFSSSTLRLQPFSSPPFPPAYDTSVVSFSLKGRLAHAGSMLRALFFLLLLTLTSSRAIRAHATSIEVGERFLPCRGGIREEILARGGGERLAQKVLA